MEILLKNIKHYESMSEETYCFEANLYVDGKKVGRVSNRGKGGCHDYDFDWKKEQELDQWCKDNLPKWKMFDQPYLEGHPKFDPNGKHKLMDTSLEFHITQLVDKFLDNQELKKLLRRGVIVVDDTCSNFQILEWKFSKFKGEAKEEVIKVVKNHVENEDQFHNPIVLNSLPFDKALQIFTRK
tara:strand:- start:2994 stop:3542 length:549 start_codon:yes stop_codon:yes gene_type:complete